MGKLVFAMNVSIDGYVDNTAGDLSSMGAPGPKLFAWWTDSMRDVAVEILGRTMYEVMRYWDEDRPEWGVAEREFAELWRAVPKYVVSTTLSEVGPNATLIKGDIVEEVRALKARTDGALSVSGPTLAGLMTEHGLIDEYHLVVRPFVLGAGKPLFRGARPKLRLLSHEQLDEETILLTYANA